MNTKTKKSQRLRGLIAAALSVALLVSQTACTTTQRIPTPVAGDSNTLPVGEKVTVTLKSRKSVSGRLTAVGENSIRVANKEIPFSEIRSIEVEKSSPGATALLIAVLVVGSLALLKGFFESSGDSES